MSGFGSLRRKLVGVIEKFAVRAGERRDMLQKARGFRADALVADLEDSVPPDEKSAARELVAELAPTLSAAGQKVMVRVNSLDTGRTAEELRAVVFVAAIWSEFGEGGLSVAYHGVRPAAERRGSKAGIRPVR